MLSLILQVSGLAFCLVSLDDYAFGLYFILIAIVGYILAFSFCIVEPEDRKDMTIAKEMWSKAQKSLRRPVRTSSSHGADVDSEFSATDSKDDAQLALLNLRIQAKVRAANLRDFGNNTAPDEGIGTSTSAKASSERESPVVHINDMRMPPPSPNTPSPSIHIPILLDSYSVPALQPPVNFHATTIIDADHFSTYL